MTVPLHGDLTTAENLHRIGVIASGDPGAIGPGKVWIDSDDGAVRVRNVADSGWLGPFATLADITAAIAALVDSAPGVLDTLNELAAALGDDANFAATIATALAGKVDESLLDAKGDLYVASAADTPARLPVGTDGQVLTADAAEATGVKWSTPGSSGIPATIVDAKGDLIAATAADTVARLAAGANGKVLVAASGETTGLKWDWGFSRFDAGNSGTSATLDWANGPTQLLTLTGNVGTLTLSNPQSGGVYVIELKQDGTGSRTVTWPASVKWSGGAAPTLTTTAGRTDMVTLFYNGTNYAASYSLDHAL